MKNKSNQLSDIRIKRIREQGYFSHSIKEINDLAFGNRFAYRLCGGILTIGVITANIPLLVMMMTIAFFSIVLPNHPFDYIYNGFLAKKMNKPQLPARSMQLKFACTMATFWIAITIYLFVMDRMLAGYLMGGGLIVVATAVGYLDLCIPSKLYNAIVLSEINLAKY